MGQTLTHGVYLPDEGERNCYDGLAANWQLLDGAVGTIAEHTTQIAGKAPAVHTHTKSDITDLFNSDFVPSADITYNIGSATYRWNSVWAGSFKSKSTNIDLTDSATTGNKESWYFVSYDKNENAFFSLSNQRNHSAGSNEEHFRLKNASGKWADFYLKLTDSNEFSVALSMHSDVTNKGFRGKFVPTAHLIPTANNTYDLGSSSYQWNNVYSKGYYYNGTPWGLDKSNVWTGNNTFTSTITTKTNIDRTVAPTSDSTYGTIICRDKNGSAMFRMQGTIKTDLSNVWDMMMVAPNGSYIAFFKYTISSSSSDRELRFKATSVIPDDNSTSNLGNSTNQWSSVYAQTYYYNGTAWGLDKANEWSAENTYTNILLTLKHTALQVGVLPASNQTKRYRFADKDNVTLGWLQHRVNTSGDSYLELYSVNKFSNGQLSPQGSDVANSLIVGLHSDGKRYAQIMSDLYPANTNFNCNLGTSTNKWKSLNGINPGALSLPNTPGGTGTENINYYDLSGNITVRDGHTYNSYTAPCDGWIAIGSFASWLQISNDTLKIATTANPGADGFAQTFLPVRKGNAIRIVINQTKTQFQSFKLLPCEGNV